ncbi:transposase, partial [uncultured Porphyromonas sp.]|uniref:transposase n=1 Tax=uncultured Porphyromonas sp. TaxID=159274 RepID=UPI002804670E
MAYQSKNTDEHVTFADALLSKRYRKAQNDFLNQVERLIDWRPIRTLINKKYTKRQNAIGAPAYDVILLFKMLLLETWYNLSDCAPEERINDSITFSRFLGLKMEEVSPDHSTISRFRSALTELGLMDKLLAQFNKQLSRHHISVREGVLVDASLVEIRSTIERSFGSIRRWFHGGRCRYRGLAKTHT